MREIRVNLGRNSYSILIGAGILDKAGTLFRRVAAANSVMLVSNPTVFGLYGKTVVESLQESGFKVTTALMPDGEEYKNMDEVIKVLDRAVEANLERSSLIAALGGGVVGDLAGFAASIYQRGIDFIQIPTTLLAQVDSSVGGKVGVNHPQGKNLIGAFHQPALVIIDSRTLATLADREYRSGLGEVVKYGIIFDEDFFYYLEDNAVRIREKDETCIEYLICRSCQIKSEIVEKDEKETGLRSILNLGHTFGHSLEKLGKYKVFRHGEAVVLGTVAASYLALDMGILDQAEVKRIVDLYRSLELPVQFPDWDPREIYIGMLNDKKVLNQRLRLVLPRGIGNYALIEGIGEKEIIAAIKKAQEIQ